MPAKKFRFVSPGVQIKEIDKSILPTLPGQVGPLVIGRSVKGPAMVPVTVQTYEEFVQKFGEPDPGLGSNDVWRNGNNTGPTYGSYAAKAWLESSTPLTFLRLGGVEHPDSTGSGKAGWQTSGSLNVSTASNGGAFGLFIVPAGNGTVGSLAAIFYLDEGSIGLSGSTGIVTRDLVPSLPGSTTPEFKVVIKNKDDNQVEKVTFNFDKDSSKFIRKAFNTNPVLVNNVLFDDPKTYWLGESFEDHIIESVLNGGGAAAAGDFKAFICGLKAGTNAASNFRKPLEQAKTGWVMSQHLSAETGSFDPATDCVKLFRLVAGEGMGGDYEQGKYKLSVFDIKPPTSVYEKYGTFSVGVRNMDDSDQSPEFLEVFTGLNLNPKSPNYIAARIGDRRITWDETDERFIELGSFDNNSKVIYVEMNPLVEKGAVDAGLLPAGFFGPTRYAETDIDAAGAPTPASSVLNVANTDPNTVDLAKLYTQAEVHTIQYPRLPLLVSASDANTLDPTQAYFGFAAGDPMKESVKDLLKAKPNGISAHDPENGVTEYSFVFTLDDLVVDTDENTAVWQAGSRKAGNSYTAVTGSVPSLAANDFSELLELGFNKFTMPLVGGFDGLDITEKEPFRNSGLAGKSEKESYALHTLKRAVTSVKDPEVIDMNLMVMPGVTDSAVTSHMLRIASNRADTLAIIDVPSYLPDTENSDDELERIGSVSSVVSHVKERVFNTSYGCTYYPWVQVRDESGVKIWIPPSVAAFGTMASSQENSEVWFAPAGFNRGGLSEGSSGLSVVAVRDKLTSKQRDSLYERNVNPIANFPSEGIVVFGQKTLQAIPSALDRINVRRMLIFLKKEISKIAADVLFEPNVQDTWRRFSLPTTRLLEEVKSGFGIADYRLVLDETTTTAEEIDRNMMYAKLFIKPVYAIEFIGIDFIITNTGASFDDL